MKATIIEFEYDHLADFCYWHGGVRVHDSWYDSEGKTTRFLTSDRRHPDVDTYSYVYISKKIGPSKPMHLVPMATTYNVATCKDEDGDLCYVLCSQNDVTDVIEFDKLGFMPYDRNPELNRFGRNRYDY